VSLTILVVSGGCVWWFSTSDVVKRHVRVLKVSVGGKASR